MSSGFVTESEIAEARRKRQEEWERVRNADQPLEAPEEQYDSRSLYDRLQEQKQKKDLEYEEAHKLKNMIKGLDDDEIEFLDLVDRTKLAAERKKTLDEERELSDYRNRVASLQEKSLDQRIHAEITGALTCIGILPGLGCYNDSSESEVSTDSEAECTKVDMLGRKIKKQEKSE
ncbi:uncharacterized protein CBL_08733 [Carabus blaptoides fortunei]